MKWHIDKKLVGYIEEVGRQATCKLRGHTYVDPIRYNYDPYWGERFIRRAADE